MVAIRDSKTTKIAKFLTEEIFTRWGTPRFLLSDRGAQFTGQIMKDVCQMWGVIQKLTTSYHPQTNLTERINRTLKTMIASFVGENHWPWDRWLPEFRFAINTAQQETTGFSPAELALGRKLKGPLDRLITTAPPASSPQYNLLERQQMFLNTVRQRVEVAQPRQAKYYNAYRRNVQFLVGDLV